MKLKRHILLVYFTVFCAVALAGGFKFAMPMTPGDPIRYKLTVVEYEQVNRAFREPSGVMRSLILEYFPLESYDAFNSLNLTAKTTIVLKICSTLGVSDRASFLRIHFNQLTPEVTKKLLSVSSGYEKSQYF